MNPGDFSASARSFYNRVWTRKAGVEGSVKPGREVYALPFIPPRARVLDLGCGDGRLLDLAPSPALAVGAEIAPAALALARERGHSVVLATLEGQYLPFRSRSFDRVACLAVIEHLFDPRPLLAEIHRVLSQGGLAIFHTPNIRHYRHVFRLMVRGQGPKTSGDPEGVDGGHLHYFTFRDVESLLRDAGFAEIEFRGTEGVRFLPTFRSLGILAVARKGA